MRLIAVKVINIKDLENEKESGSVEADLTPTNEGANVPFS